MQNKKNLISYYIKNTKQSLECCFHINYLHVGQTNTVLLTVFCHSGHRPLLVFFSVLFSDRNLLQYHIEPKPWSLQI